MSTESADAPHYVRLQIELIAEVTDAEALRRGATTRVREDGGMDEEERAESLRAIEIDPSGAVAHFVDPVELLADVPGIELAQASWETEQVDYDPDNEDWDFYDTDENLEEG